ncbi:mitochondrial Complex V (CV) F1Fo ATP synthase ATPase inhibitor protein Inh1/IATP [Andalucia godoyi]|uniref:Mitochondrial Complex V (CV) F1Fo ATP synthase ATPase inhibitor protein Inh1/IATP n=1 Tax=Andalucia godoyi TaxID=505711 RepID=A0A8K0F4G4_ANDGO|nr:mitochondrial Complex V (CV) F1Fo ATP synthase ATPase inhibitor protein Inh1/IATP [Andalucia godoyi]|eukprot:ANDGO_00600.mRNA.1 mitochondrial Complex V (CV) F1Fo ATP synthase ATPase inhibitor protein Inh1/IATP
MMMTLTRIALPSVRRLSTTVFTRRFSADAFKERERALEESYFHKVAKQQLDKLKAKAQALATAVDSHAPATSSQVSAKIKELEEELARLKKDIPK